MSDGGKSKERAKKRGFGLIRFEFSSHACVSWLRAQRHAARSWGRDAMTAHLGRQTVRVALVMNQSPWPLSRPVHSTIRFATRPEAAQLPASSTATTVRAAWSCQTDVCRPIASATMQQCTAPSLPERCDGGQIVCISLCDQRAGVFQSMAAKCSWGRACGHSELFVTLLGPLSKNR